MFVTLIVTLAAVAAPAETETVTVKSVPATHTVVVRTATEDSLTVSLLGVGTPDTASERKPQHLIGKDDPNWTRQVLPAGTRCRMERRGETHTGRPLVVLYRIPDGLSYNEWLVKSGGAFATTGDYTAQESRAKEARAGIWASLPAPAAEPARTASRQTTFTGVAGGTGLNERPHYAPQDWSALNAAMNAMMNPGNPRGRPGVNPNMVWVESYMRADGTVVRGHWRTAPNGTTSDNLGSR